MSTEPTSPNLFIEEISVGYTPNPDSGSEHSKLLVASPLEPDDLKADADSDMPSPPPSPVASESKSRMEEDATSTALLLEYAKAYIASGDEADKLAYLSAYEACKSNTPKQQLFAQLLKTKLDNSSLLRLLESHRFPNLRDVDDISICEKPLIAYLLGQPLTELFYIDVHRQDNYVALYRILVEPKIHTHAKQMAIEAYLRDNDSYLPDAQSPLMPYLRFYLEEALYADLNKTESSQTAKMLLERQHKRLSILARLEECSPMVLAERIVTRWVTVNHIKEDTAELMPSFRAQFLSALTAYDQIKKMEPVEKEIAKQLGIHPVDDLTSLSAFRLMPSKPSHSAGEQEEEKVVQPPPVLSPINRIHMDSTPTHLVNEGDSLNATAEEKKKEEEEEEKTPAPVSTHASLYWEVQDGNTHAGADDRTYHFFHESARLEDRGFEICGVTRKKFVTELLDTLHEGSRFSQPPATRALRDLLSELYSALLLNGALDNVARETDLAVKKAYLANPNSERETKTLKAHCDDLQNLSHFIHRYIGWEGALPWELAEWYLEKHQVLYVAEKRNEAGISPPYFGKGSKHPRSVLAENTDEDFKYILVREENDQYTSYRRLSAKTKPTMAYDGRLQLLTVGLYIACIQYVYEHLSHGPELPNDVACGRLLGYITALNTTTPEEHDFICTNLEKWLKHPLFFERGKPSIIPLKHAVLRHLLEEKDILPFRQPPYNQQRALSVDPQLISLQLEKHFREYLSKLNQTVQTYAEKFKQWKEEKALREAKEAPDNSPRRTHILGFLTACFSADNSAAAVETLQIDLREFEDAFNSHDPASQAPGIKTIEQLKALLQIQQRFEKIRQPYHIFYYYFDDRETREELDEKMGADHRTMMHRPSMEEDYRTLYNDIDESATDALFDFVKTLTRAYGYYVVAEGDQLAHQQETTLLFKQITLNRFYRAFNTRMLQLPTEESDKIHMKAIIRASQASPGAELQVAHVDDLERQLTLRLGSLFPTEVAAPEEKLDLNFNILVQQTVVKLIHYYQEQLCLIKTQNDQEKFARFLAKMVGLFICSGGDCSNYTDLLNWLDRGPELFEQAPTRSSAGVPFAGPEITLTTQTQKVTCMDLLRLSGHRCQSSNGQEVRYWLKTAKKAQEEAEKKAKQKPAQLPNLYVFGCKTTATEEQLKEFNNALCRGHAYNTWNESQSRPCWIDENTLKRTAHNYNMRDKYELIKENFDPKAALSNTDRARIAELERKEKADKEQLKQQLETQKKESDQKITGLQGELAEQKVEIERLEASAQERETSQKAEIKRLEDTINNLEAMFEEFKKRREAGGLPPAPP